ncbi:MAG: tetratricopeptide repeat protein, partial [Gemmatimonadetes bacterium]|nr:tetratricopeptide repeat protein [Gemmatimonadota bacterium]
ARAHSALLAGLVWHHGLAFPFGIVGPLALVGLLLAIRERRAGLIVLFVLCHAAAVVAFSATARYRLPAVPLLILLACYAGAWLMDRVSARQWGSVVPAAGLLLLVALPLNAWAVAPAEDARDRYCVGLAYARQGMPARAALELRKALDLDEGHYDARLKLGELLVDLDNSAEAREQFRLLARRYPLRVDPRRNLANLHLEEGRIEEAAALFEEIVELEPTAASSHYGLAGALRLAERLEAARDSYLKALELDPGHFEAGYHLAVLYQQEGRWREAERLYLQLLEQRPGHDDVRNNLGYSYLRQRQFQAAAAEFSHVLDGNPDHVLARRNLAFAYEGLERYREAVREYERLIEQGEEAEVYNHLARLYGKMGQTEKSGEARRKHRMVLRRQEIFGKLRERTERIFEEAAGAR